jgi:hypothetical protein
LLVAKEKNKKENFFYKSQFMSWGNGHLAKQAYGWVAATKAGHIHCDVIGI